MMCTTLSSNSLFTVGSLVAALFRIVSMEAAYLVTDTALSISTGIDFSRGGSWSSNSWD